MSAEWGWWQRAAHPGAGGGCAGREDKKEHLKKKGIKKKKRGGGGEKGGGFDASAGLKAGFGDSGPGWGGSWRRFLGLQEEVCWGGLVRGGWGFIPSLCSAKLEMAMGSGRQRCHEAVGQ